MQWHLILRMREVPLQVLTDDMTFHGYPSSIMLLLNSIYGANRYLVMLLVLLADVCGIGKQVKRLYDDHSCATYFNYSQIICTLMDCQAIDVDE